MTDNRDAFEALIKSYGAPDDEYNKFHLDEGELYYVWEKAIMASKGQQLSNTEILIFIRGWQGGTVHQIAQELDVSTNDILNAGYENMQTLMRKAQAAKVVTSGVTEEEAVERAVERAATALIEDMGGAKAPQWYENARTIAKKMLKAAGMQFK